MPKTCENWTGLVNSWVYYAHQTHEIDQVMPYSVDFKAPEIKDLETYEITEKLKKVTCTLDL